MNLNEIMGKASLLVDALQNKIGECNAVKKEYREKFESLIDLTGTLSKEKDELDALREFVTSNIKVDDAKKAIADLHENYAAFQKKIDIENSKLEQAKVDWEKDQYRKTVEMKNKESMLVDKDNQLNGKIKEFNIWTAKFGKFEEYQPF